MTGIEPMAQALQPGARKSSFAHLTNAVEHYSRGVELQSSEYYEAIVPRALSLGYHPAILAYTAKYGTSMPLLSYCPRLFVKVQQSENY